MSLSITNDWTDGRWSDDVRSSSAVLEINRVKWWWACATRDDGLFHAPGVTGGKYTDGKSCAHSIVNVRVKFKQLVEWQLMNLKTSRSESFLESLTDVTDVPSLVAALTTCKDCNVDHHETLQIHWIFETPSEHYFTRDVKNRKENFRSFQPFLESVI